MVMANSELDRELHRHTHAHSLWARGKPSSGGHRRGGGGLETPWATFVTDDNELICKLDLFTPWLPI